MTTSIHYQTNDMKGKARQDNTGKKKKTRIQDAAHNKKSIVQEGGRTKGKNEGEAKGFWYASSDLCSFFAK